MRQNFKTEFQFSTNLQKKQLNICKKRQYANLISLQQLTDRYTPLYLGERKNKRTKDHLKQKNSLWEPDLLNEVFFARFLRISKTVRKLSVFECPMLEQSKSQ